LIPTPFNTLRTLALAAALLATAGNTWAGVARTFVSAGGSDANTTGNCAPTTPCRTFATALGVTNAGGEIVAISSGGYGPFAIAQSVTVTVPQGVYAGISVASGSGITIAGAGISVTLRGLTINGAGGSTAISMTSGASLSIQGVQISNFSGASGDAGIQVSGATAVEVLDSVVRDTSCGICVANGAALTVSRTQFLGTYSASGTANGTAFSSIYGVLVESSDGASTTSASVFDCFASEGVEQAYAALNPASGGTVDLVVERSTGGALGPAVSATTGGSAAPGAMKLSVSHSQLGAVSGVAAISAAGASTVGVADANTFALGTGATSGLGGQVVSFGNNATTIAGSGITVVPTK